MRMAQQKGVNLLGTGDFTHPNWFSHINEELEEVNGGIYAMKSAGSTANDRVRFLLTTEVSCVFSYRGKRKGVHLLVFLPSIETVESFNKQLAARGANLSDGRPVIGTSCYELTNIAMGVSQNALVIPAHSFTPWFGVYGANGGFESLNEAFEGMERYIPAIETGMSASPAMCWGIEELKDKSIVSFSDAHSLPKIGREATVFDVRDEFSYTDVYEAIWQKKGKAKIDYTIEFYPEEGKYHFTGHRNCGVKLSPGEINKNGLVCEVCGKKLTMGVADKIEALTRVAPEVKLARDNGVVRYEDARGLRPGFVMLVPLEEIVSQALGYKNTLNKKVTDVIATLVNSFGSEIGVLMGANLSEVARLSGEKIAQGIHNIRSGDVVIDPGYDGVYGRVSIFKETPELKLF